MTSYDIFQYVLIGFSFLVLAIVWGVLIWIVINTNWKD